LAAEKPRNGGEFATIKRWPDALGELHTRVAERFHRPEVRQRARRYLAGLLGRLERKNGWQMAEAMGEMGPQGAQRLLNAARWDAEAVRDDLREYVVEHLGEEVRFATKGELAKEMLERAFEARVPARWVVADTVYGTARGLRGWLEEQGRSYVLAVPGTKGIYHEGRQRQARSLAKDLPEDAWARASAGAGSKGDRLYDWALVSLPEPKAPGAGRWLLIRRSIGDPTELAYYLAYGPKEMPAEELIRVAGRRWTIEDCFEQAKGEVGLDEYEVRKWDAWHRHVTLSLLAHAYLAVLRSEAHDAALEVEAKRGIVATSS
jgi:SRSO17 transposase